MYTPTTAELRAAIAEAHSMTLLGQSGGLRHNVKHAHPDWLVSSKTLKRACHDESASTPPAAEASDKTKWSGLLIHPDIYGGGNASSMDAVLSHLDLCEVDFTPQGAIEKLCLRDLLNADGGQLLLNFYDRDDKECGWYYSAYYAPANSTTLSNSVVSSITKEPVAGRVLVVLDGPKAGNWMDTAILDPERLARTIWWYKQSGSDVAEVLGERELRRFVLSLNE